MNTGREKSVSRFKLNVSVSHRYGCLIHRSTDTDADTGHEQMDS